MNRARLTAGRCKLRIQNQAMKSERRPRRRLPPVAEAAGVDAAAGAGSKGTLSRPANFCGPSTGKTKTADGFGRRTTAMESIRQPRLGEAVEPDISAGRYLEESPKDDVMMEQLEYLLRHVRTGCTGQCTVCVRLQKVSRYLLSPFRTMHFQRRKK
jgi:hypothetical protein